MEIIIIVVLLSLVLYQHFYFIPELKAKNSTLAKLATIEVYTTQNLAWLANLAIAEVREGKVEYYAKCFNEKVPDSFLPTANRIAQAYLHTFPRKEEVVK